MLITPFVYEFLPSVYEISSGDTSQLLSGKDLIIQSYE